MTDTAAVTQRGIDILTEHIPHGTVTGEYYTDPVPHWTWVVTVPAPTEETPDATAGASRQFVATDDMPQPTDEYLGLVATEILSTFPTGVTA